MITLNINGLISPIKMAQSSRLDSEAEAIFLLHHQNFNVRHHPRIKEWKKKIFKANGSKKQTREAILISVKTDFKPKVIRRYREEH